MCLARQDLSDRGCVMFVAAGWHGRLEMEGGKQRDKKVKWNETGDEANRLRRNKTKETQRMHEKEERKGDEE